MSYLGWKPSLPEQFSAADKREQHVEELLVFVGPQQLYQERVTDLLNISHYKMLSFKKTSYRQNIFLILHVVHLL